jgi:hypothetical protein
MFRTKNYGRLSAAFLLVLVSYCVLSSPMQASASSACNTSANALSASVAKGLSVSQIKSLATSFRSCMARQADSANAASPAAGEVFYSLFTDPNLYSKIPNGKAFGLSAYQQYRFLLDGAGGGVSSCDSYSSLVTVAKAKSFPSLASVAAKVGTECKALLSSTPRGQVSVQGDIYPGARVTGSISGSFSRATLTYKWFVQGSLASSSSSRNFKVPTNAVGKNLELKVEIKLAGSNTVTNSSARYLIAASPMGQDPTSGTKELLLTPAPSASGSTQVGSTLTALPGLWDSGVVLTYQWLRNGVAISGATNLTYLLAAADSGAEISVKVTGSKAGYRPVSRTSAPLTASAASGVQNLVLTPVPTVSGSTQVGSTLTALPGLWDSGVVLTYQWLRNGAAISGATNLTYLLAAADSGAEISVKVTGSKAGYIAVSQLSTPLSISATTGAQKLLLTPTPTISGSDRVGSTLTAVTGIWDSGVVLTYQWLRNGVAISGATSPNYELVSADADKLIYVRVTGSKSGYSTVSKLSSSSMPISAFLLTPVPTISGSAQVGSTLTAVAGTWDSGVVLSYQWLRNGVAISGASSLSYTVVLADRGALMAVKVTGSKTGYVSGPQTSSAVSISGFLLSPVPTVSGFAQVGSTLTGVPGVWDAGAVLAYQWLRNGTAIVGSTGLNYLITSSDLGTTISFQVTGTKSVSYSSTQVSASQLVTSADKVLSLTPVPTLGNGCLGVGNVGESVSARLGTWDSGVVFTFMWLRNGNPISGATYQSYPLTAADSGASLSVSVTGSKTGYLSVTKVSQARICRPSNPSISGLRLVGKVLSTNLGSWDPFVSISYQWFKTDKQHGLPFDWSPISGAVSSTYQLQGTDAGESVLVKVTGTSTQDTRQSITLSSQSLDIFLQAISPNSRPVINGNANVGSTLTVSKGVWLEGVWLVAAWYVDGVWIKDGDDYLIRSIDLGKKITVKVTGSKPYYDSYTTSSFSVTVS